MLRAERDLVLARVAARNRAQQAGEAFATAIRGLRDLSTPYHLAHGLIDHARYLRERGESDATAEAIEEARSIAEQLRCQPLLDRLDYMSHAASPVPA
jgi:hypothetical protein